MLKEAKRMVVKQKGKMQENEWNVKNKGWVVVFGRMVER
jgi:hypothetical protein